MKAAELLAMYVRVADAPDAVGRLRQLVLDLSVRGKLVPQDTTNPSQSAPIGNSVQEPFTPSGRTGVLASAAAAGFPYALPTGWRWVAFGRLQSVVRGVTYSKSDVTDSPSPGFVPVLRANNIGVSLSHDDPVFVRKERVSAEQFLRKGDFLIALSSGSKNLVGKAAFVPEDLDEAFGGFCGVIRMRDTELVPYTFCYLRSSLYRRSIADGSRGIGINNLKMSTISELQFPLPPLAEQPRIVAKVDELMALCDQLEAARKEREAARDRLAAASLARLNAPDPDTFQADARFALNVLPALSARPDQVKQLRQTILNLAVRGKLVNQIAEEHTDLASPSRLPPLGVVPQETDAKRASSQQGGIPATWQWTTLGEIGDWGSGSTPPRSNEAFFGGSVSWFKSGELNDSIALVGSQERVTEKALSSCTFRKNRPGDVLIAMYGATIGRVAILAETAVTNQAVCACTPLPHVFNRFLFLYLLSQRAQFQLASEGGAQPNISKAKIVSTAFPLPPLAEQRRIVAKVEELMALCDKLEASLSTGEAARIRLLEAVLHEALGSEHATAEGTAASSTTHRQRKPTSLRA